MKTTILIPLSFILFLFSASSAPDSVIDFTGKIVRPGINYYVMPAARDGSSGGITLAATGNMSCPSGVAQLRTDEYGMPLTFSPVNPKKGVIRLSTDLNIKFSGSTSCNESNVWEFKYDEDMKQYFVMVGGVEGNPGSETISNWFKIEKTKDGYKFVLCPSVCNYCEVICKDFGITLDGNGVRRLVLSDVPFSWIFMR
ncbi:hypothetical protein L1887_29031 [Cichorium endivia]|nr:hypothetical protein L1887_29031 [Cichorium endivia]